MQIVNVKALHILTWKIFQAYIAFIFGEKRIKLIYYSTYVTTNTLHFEETWSKLLEITIIIKVQADKKSINVTILTE